MDVVEGILDSRIRAGAHVLQVRVLRDVLGFDRTRYAYERLVAILLALTRRTYRQRGGVPSALIVTESGVPRRRFFLLMDELGARRPGETDAALHARLIDEALRSVPPRERD